MKDCLLQELRFFLEKVTAFDEGVLPIVTSIFFGGGTPSLALPDTFSAIINHVKTNNTCDPMSKEIEITMEANPTSVEREKMKEFSGVGVSRLSLGVQALNNHDLTYLGRNHSASEAEYCLTEARKFFPRVNMDLIYSRHSNQTQDMWRQELRVILFAIPLHYYHHYHRRHHSHRHLHPYCTCHHHHHHHRHPLNQHLSAPLSLLILHFYQPGPEGFGI
eukprot:TRINITY_DN4207_c0_g1_i14.p1 TRINITY_DN4207_c0_g1~~TRINITY_DN4207_c0_g1_i14.p1  ORF type:complete len:219 (+),score=47.47 TRINITY_DN4207_c0_g1_i14:832-1488(+)